MRFDDVSLRYDRRGPWILRGITAAARPGQVVVVTGRNGTGKSTLLRAAAGLLRPARGTITGRPAVVAWVPERFPTSMPFTVREYLTALGRMKGADRPPVPEWAERLHFANHLDVRLATLSKGTAQKVGIAQAMLTPPGLLILDEPWEGLDAQTRTELPALLGEAVAAGSTVLVSDHLGAAERLAGVVRWLVRDGQVIAATGAGGPTCTVTVTVTADELPAVESALHNAGVRDIAVSFP